MEIYVVNVKCNGCANTVTKELKKAGFKDIEVHFTENDSHFKRKISFKGDKQKALEILDKLGYPEYGSQKANNLLKKLKSFVSCGVGKLN